MFNKLSNYLNENEIPQELQDKVFDLVDKTKHNIVDIKINKHCYIEFKGNISFFVSDTRPQLDYDLDKIKNFIPLLFDEINILIMGIIFEDLNSTWYRFIEDNFKYSLLNISQSTKQQLYDIFIQAKTAGMIINYEEFLSIINFIYDEYNLNFNYHISLLETEEDLMQDIIQLIPFIKHIKNYHLIKSLTKGKE